MGKKKVEIKTNLLLFQLAIIQLKQCNSKCMNWIRRHFKVLRSSIFVRESIQFLFYQIYEVVVTEQDIKKVIRNLANWKKPGNDKIRNF